MQAIEDARFAEETAALDVWLVQQKGCYEEWKSEEWKEKQVRQETQEYTVAEEGSEFRGAN